MARYPMILRKSTAPKFVIMSANGSQPDFRIPLLVRSNKINKANNQSIISLSKYPDPNY